MRNIFKKAYFGKAYKTRDGRKAIYGGTNEGSLLHDLMFQTEDGDGFLGLYNANGTYFMSKAPWLDIVSEWQDFADEEELEELANKIYPCWCSSENANCDICIHPKLIEAFKKGCRKSLEKNKNFKA